MTLTVRDMRRRLLDGLGDLMAAEGAIWADGHPVYKWYLRRPEWLQIAGTAFKLFGARCWICGRTARQVERRGEHLSTAHIVYPPEPFTEVVDAEDLTRSDVVVLCWPHHQDLDDWARKRAWRNVEQLRMGHVEWLRTTRLEHDDS